MLNGELSYEDTAGKRGEVSAGGIEWMKSGNGGWLEGHAASGAPLRVFQLWIALSPSETSSAAESEYIAPQELELDGAVGVLLGQFGRARSRIRGAPTGTNYFHVRLEDGQRWSYAAPDAHNVTWLAVDRGRLRSQQGERVHWGQIAVFGDWRGVIEMQADGETSFVLGSARRYPIRSCWASTRPSRPDAARAGGSFLRPRDRSDLVGARRPVIMVRHLPGRNAA